MDGCPGRVDTLLFFLGAAGVNDAGILEHDDVTFDHIQHLRSNLSIRLAR